MRKDQTGGDDVRIGMKAARDEAKLKQTDLAKILGVSVNTYIEWEKERKELPSKEMADKFAKACGFKLSQLRIRYRDVVES